MKIAYVSPWWPKGPKPNGIVTYLTMLVEQLRQLGHEVFVLTWKKDNACHDTNVIEISAHNPRRSILQSGFDKVFYSVAPGFAHYRRSSQALLAEVRKLIREENIDILQIEDSFGNSRAVIEGTSLPVVVRLHGPYFLNGEFEDSSAGGLDSGRIRREGLGIKMAHGISSPSQQVMDATFAYYGLSPNRIRAAMANPVMPPPIELKWSLENCDRNRILFVGRTDKRKGGDLVLKVFQNLLADNAGLTLDFVGPDHGLEDPQGRIYSWNEYLAAFVPEEVRSRIHYHGRLKAEDIAPLRRRAFITLAFSRYETFGNVCTEALSYGSPLVATNVGGIPEIVRDGHNGLLGNPDDVVDLQRKVQYLIDHPEKAAEYGEQGWTTCKAEFDPRTQAMKEAAFLTSVVEATTTAGQ